MGHCISRIGHIGDATGLTLYSLPPFTFEVSPILLCLVTVDETSFQGHWQNRVHTSGDNEARE